MKKVGNLILQNCSFANILISSIPFIIAYGGNLLTVIFRDIAFSKSTTAMGSLIMMQNVDRILINRITILDSGYLQILEILDSKLILIKNCSIYCKNTISSDGILQESLFFFQNVNKKLMTNIIFQECANNYTTPGIKIISNIGSISKTLIKNSIFYQNTIYYTTDYQIGGVLYIEGQNEFIFIKNSNFLENYLLPQTDQGEKKIGGTCLRSFGKNLNVVITDSLFRENGAIFDSNCIEFLGNTLTINNSRKEDFWKKFGKNWKKF